MQTYCGLITTLFFTCYSFLAQSQSNHVGSGQMLEFNGTTDYVDLGNIYDDLQLPVTISAWVYITSDPGYTYPIFNSQDNLPIYNGITFAVSADRIGIQYGDGFGEGTGEFYRGKGANCPDLRNRWVHVCGVMKNANDMQIYVNGNDIGGSYGGYTSRPIGSNFPGDVAKIGYWYSNGATYKFKGKMDELRLWNRALTQEEVRETMCKRITDSEPGLIGYWNFDEVSGTEILDQSANKFHGTIKGNPKRGFSGAPIGDESNYQYNASWTNKSVTSSDGIIEVNNIRNNPEGIHIYKVLHTPSQTGGITGPLSKEYYGIFSAATGVGKFYDIILDEFCQAYERNDNSNSVWATSINPRISVPDRIELIPAPSVAPFKVDFGPDVQLCDQSSHNISIGIDPSGKDIRWSTGESTETLTVNTSGTYSVTVRQGCLLDRDTIEIQFLITPQLFSFGQDELLCEFSTRVLKPYETTHDSYLFTWQDGSHSTEYTVTDFGKFWVSIENFCGLAHDTISILRNNKELLANVGPDVVLCDKSTYTITTGIDDLSGKSIEWSTGTNASSITVNTSGIYSVTIKEGCLEDQDSVAVEFQKTPIPFSLGDDEEGCKFEARKLQPYSEQDDSFIFTWQDGSNLTEYDAIDFGEYWVNIRNSCGSVSDTITFTKREVANFLFPNIITPNGDGKNEFFELDPAFVGSKFLVFNRWGIPIFSSNYYENDWNGDDESSGVYFYVIVNECFDFKGSVTVIK